MAVPMRLGSSGIRWLCVVACLAWSGAACGSCDDPDGDYCKPTQCTMDTDCSAGHICEKLCCVEGCRDDGDCAGSDFTCQPKSGTKYSTCVSTGCMPLFDLDGQVFDVVYNCTRTYTIESRPAYCSESERGAQLKFAKRSTNGDNSVVYGIQSVPVDPGETWSGTLCRATMSVALTTAASGSDPAYTETGEYAFSDANSFAGSSTYVYDLPSSDINAGGGSCTQAGMAGATPPAPAPIAPLCPATCAADGAGCAGDGECCSGVCYNNACVP